MCASVVKPVHYTLYTAQEQQQKPLLPLFWVLWLRLGGYPPHSRRREESNNRSNELRAAPTRGRFLTGCLSVCPSEEISVKSYQKKTKQQSAAKVRRCQTINCWLVWWSKNLNSREIGGILEPFNSYRKTGETILKYPKYIMKTGNFSIGSKVWPDI